MLSIGKMGGGQERYYLEKVADDVMIVADLRLFERGLSGQEAAQLATNGDIERFLAKPADERTDEASFAAMSQMLDGAGAGAALASGDEG